MASWQNDPVVGGAPAAGGWQSDPIVGGATAQAPSANDYSKSPISALARTFESSADWGVGDLLRAAATGKKPSETAAQSSAAAASLPWYVRYPTEAAGYGLGLVNLLDPVTDAAEAGAAALGAGTKLAKVAGTAAEGATVGAVSHVAGSDDPGLSDTAGAALGGAALGGVAGGVGAGIAKLTAKPGTIDPQAAISATKSARDALYGKLQSTPVGSNSLKNAYASATLTPGMAADVSPGFNALIGRQLAQVDAGGITANDVADFAKNLKAGATSNGDTILAGKISDNLLGALPADAQQTLQQANAAHQQYMMALNLRDWQQQVASGGSIGGKPLTEAQNYYQGDPDKFAALSDVANQGGADHGIGYMLGHLAAHTLGIGGYAAGGVPGSLLGEALGLGVVRPAIFKAMKGAGQKSKLANLQSLYPQMTGQQLTGAQPGLQVGDAVKNLMLGSVY